jgi:hypothetical protein
MVFFTERHGLPEHLTRRRLHMAETETTKTVQVKLPAEYKGPAKADATSFSTYVGQGAGAKIKYELRLRIPKTEAECQAIYGFGLEKAFYIMVAHLATGVDSAAKDVLFRVDDKTGKAAGYSPASHLAAQKLIDDWKPSERKKGLSDFDKMVLRLKANKMLPEDAQPKDDDEMRSMSIAFLSKPKKPANTAR